MKYTATDYELFTRTLHQQIIEQEGFAEVEVQHNVFFTGRSGARHQIDVCWQMKIANVEQLFCVECKSYKTKVKKGDVAAFIAKIEDIGGARGLFVTTLGYQIGAIRLAKHKDIILMNAVYEVQNRPASLEIYLPSFHEVTTTFGFVPPQLAKELEVMSQAPAVSEDIDVYNSRGAVVCTLGGLVNGVEHHDDGYNHHILEDAYLKVSGVLVELKTISYIYKRENIGWPLEGSYEIATAHVRYVFDGKEISAVLNSHRPPIHAT